NGNPAARTFSAIKAGKASVDCRPNPAVRLSPRKTSVFVRVGAGVGVETCAKSGCRKKQRTSAIPQITGIVFLIRRESCSRKQDESAPTAYDSISNPQRAEPDTDFRD